MGRIWGVEKTVGPFPKRPRNAPRDQKRVRTGQVSIGSAGKCLAWPLCFVETLALIGAFLLCSGRWSTARPNLNNVFLLTTAQYSTPANRRKLSAAEKGGRGVSPGYNNPARTYAEEGQAKRSGQAECSGEGGVRRSPPTTAIQLVRTPMKAKPSTAARPSAAEKGGSALLAGDVWRHI